MLARSISGPTGRSPSLRPADSSSTRPERRRAPAAERASTRSPTDRISFAQIAMTRLLVPGEPAWPPGRGAPPAAARGYAHVMSFSVTKSYRPAGADFRPPLRARAGASAAARSGDPGRGSAATDEALSVGATHSADRRARSPGLAPGRSGADPETSWSESSAPSLTS